MSVINKPGNTRPILCEDFGRVSSSCRFPPEIWDQIYSLMCSEPRTINIKTQQEWCEIPGSEPFTFGYFTSRGQVPSVLQICHSSRKIAQRIYTKSFTNSTTDHHTWINYEADTVELEVGVLGKIDVEERALLQHIILNAGCVPWNMATCYKALRPMRNIKSLVILSDKKLSCWEGSLTELWNWFTGTSNQTFVGKPLDVDVSIIDIVTGEEMNYENEEDWHVQFARESYEFLLMGRAMFVDRESIEALMNEDAFHHGEEYRQTFRDVPRKIIRK